MAKLHRNPDFLHEDKQIFSEYGMDCCAVDELSNISAYRNPKEVILDALTRELPDEEGRWDDKRSTYVYDDPKTVLSVPSVAFLIFTQASQKSVADGGYGWRLANYILSQGLGAITHTAPTKNPNSRNHVTVFIWTLDEVGIVAWAKREGISVK